VTVHRTAYMPPPWLVDDVRLVFDLDPRNTLVRASLSVRRNPQAAADAPAALVLDGEQLELLELRIDGQPLVPTDYRLDERTLSIEHVPERFELDTVARIDPQANTALKAMAAGLASSDTTIPLSHLVSLGPIGKLALGTEPPGLNANANVMSLITAGAALAE